MDRGLSAANKVLSVCLNPSSVWMSWWGGPVASTCCSLPSLVSFLPFLLLVHGMDLGARSFWSPPCSTSLPFPTLLYHRTMETHMFWRAIFFLPFFYEEQKVTREWLRLMKDIWFCCMKTQLSHVLPLQLREISPPFASILATPCSQHHVIHHQALCIHPIATCIANSPRVSAEELSWRLLSRFLLEAELCCFANQHSSWVNTA